MTRAWGMEHELFLHVEWRVDGARREAHERELRRAAAIAGARIVALGGDGEGLRVLVRVGPWVTPASVAGWVREGAAMGIRSVSARAVDIVADLTLGPTTHHPPPTTISPAS